jgi:redox-sensitive bicupin YhaK (pirin superfamily)
MMTVRRSEDRGRFDHGWLDTRHTFSFADYRDERFMGFSDLRVINEDRVRAGEGFGTHGHRDMEILSYVLEGELGHRDSMGNGSVIRPGELQRMSAGTGVTHSEMNPSRDRAVHFLQIWILPRERGLAPGYEQRAFPEGERRGRLRLVASADGRDGSLTIHQDASVLAGILAPGDRVRHPIAAGRAAWVQVARGEVAVNGERLRAGDGAAAVDEVALDLAGVPGAGEDAELLVFDLRGPV